ncbi:hypothetical protein LINPERPRIM_LOCUS43664 [Linum perenne]
MSSTSELCLGFPERFLNMLRVSVDLSCTRIKHHHIETIMIMMIIIVSPDLELENDQVAMGYRVEISEFREAFIQPKLAFRIGEFHRPLSSCWILQDYPVLKILAVLPEELCWNELLRNKNN